MNQPPPKSDKDTQKDEDRGEDGHDDRYLSGSRGSRVALSHHDYGQSAVSGIAAMSAALIVRQQKRSAHSKIDPIASAAGMRIDML
jgi:hypothetical protein